MIYLGLTARPSWTAGVPLQDMMVGIVDNRGATIMIASTALHSPSRSGFGEASLNLAATPGCHYDLTLEEVQEEQRDISDGLHSCQLDDASRDAEQTRPYSRGVLQSAHSTLQDGEFNLDIRFRYKVCELAATMLIGTDLLSQLISVEVTSMTESSCLIPGGLTLTLTLTFTITGDRIIISSWTSTRNYGMMSGTGADPIEYGPDIRRWQQDNITRTPTPRSVGPPSDVANAACRISTATLLRAIACVASAVGPLHRPVTRPRSSGVWVPTLPLHPGVSRARGAPCLRQGITTSVCPRPCASVLELGPVGQHVLANVDNHEPNNNFVGRTTAVGDGGILYLPLYYGPLDVDEKLTTRSAQCRQVDRLRPNDPDAVDNNLPIYDVYDWDCPPMIYDTGGYLSRSRHLNEVNIQRLHIWRMPPDSWR